jgi:Ca2+-transporting ATPase
MSYVIAVHVSIFGMALFPLFNQDWPLVLLPLQLALLELVIDPACSIVFEAEDHDPHLMRQPPRRKGEPLFGRGRITIAVMQGVVVFVTVVGVYGWAVWSGKPDGEIRSLTFATLVLANLGLIMVNRSWRLSILGTIRERKNPAVKWIFGVTLSILSILIFVPPVRSAFDFGEIQVRDIAIPLLAAVASILWFEGYKVLHWRRISLRQ